MSPLPGHTFFEWIAAPVGPQPMPSWLKDAHIDWMEPYSCPPSITLKTNSEAREWENKTWRAANGRYIAESDDGRACQLSHSGELTWCEDHKAFITPRQEGFGGSNWPIKLDDGRDVILRGPWDVGGPAGYLPVSYVYPDAKWRGRPGADKRPWFQQTAMAGLHLSTDLYIRVLARFAPTYRIARVTRYGSTGVEPVRIDWNVPKGFERRAA